MPPACPWSSGRSYRQPQMEEDLLLQRMEQGGCDKTDDYSSAVRGFMAVWTIFFRVHAPCTHICTSILLSVSFKRFAIVVSSIRSSIYVLTARRSLSAVFYYVGKHGVGGFTSLWRGTSIMILNCRILGTWRSLCS